MSDTAHAMTVHLHIEWHLALGAVWKKANIETYHICKVPTLNG